MSYEYSLEKEILRMQESRNFPNNTCPASRHVQIIAEDLANVGKYPMLEEDPGYCAGSFASVVTNLYEARSFLASIGYSWSVDDRGNAKWKKNDQNSTSAIGEKND